jgi:hypothetical protein
MSCNADPMRHTACSTERVLVSVRGLEECAIADSKCDGEGCKTVYVYFDSDQNGYAVQKALRLQNLIR